MSDCEVTTVSDEFRLIEAVKLLGAAVALKDLVTGESSQEDRLNTVNLLGSAITKLDLEKGLLQGFMGCRVGRDGSVTSVEYSYSGASDGVPIGKLVRTIYWETGEPSVTEGPIVFKELADVLVPVLNSWANTN